ncbi:phasin family protein [Rhodoplanes azumiensis]|uniref:Phasin family protein n=1 Tax=Rhodoplanes azumiensis TaxID=1897628 RepID=A0ABW5AJG8_9BRAD
MPAKPPSDPPGEMPGLPPLDYPSGTRPSSARPSGPHPSGPHPSGAAPSGSGRSGSERVQARAADPAGGASRAAPETGPDAACGPQDADQAFSDHVLSEALHDGAELGRKLLAAFEANMTAGFGFATAMAETSSVPDMIALSSRFAARQFETALAQGKDLWTSSEKLMGDAARVFASAEADDPDDGAGPASGRR